MRPMHAYVTERASLHASLPLRIVNSKTLLSGPNELSHLPLADELVLFHHQLARSAD
jgi:hypothetical protein